MGEQRNTGLEPQGARQGRGFVKRDSVWVSDQQ